MSLFPEDDRNSRSVSSIMSFEILGVNVKSEHPVPEHSEEGGGSTVVGSAPDLEELSRLLALHRPHLLRYFQFHVPSWAVARRLVEDTCGRGSCEWPPRDDEQQSPRVWLYVLAQRVLAQQQAAWKQVLGDRDPERGPGPQLVDGADRERGPAAGVQRAFARLSRYEQEILALKFGGRLSEREIAQITGLRPVHVRLVLRRAVHKLATSLASGHGTPGEIEEMLKATGCS